MILIKKKSLSNSFKGFEFLFNRFHERSEIFSILSNNINIMTILKNMTLAPVKLLKMPSQEAEKKALVNRRSLHSTYTPADYYGCRRYCGD